MPAGGAAPSRRRLASGPFRGPPSLAGRSAGPGRSQRWARSGRLFVFGGDGSVGRVALGWPGINGVRRSMATHRGEECSERLGRSPGCKPDPRRFDALDRCRGLGSQRVRAKPRRAHRQAAACHKLWGRKQHPSAACLIRYPLPARGPSPSGRYPCRTLPAPIAVFACLLGGHARRLGGASWRTKPAGTASD